MSLQDDIFDLQAHLKGTAYEAAFEHVYDALCATERELLTAQKYQRVFEDMRRALDIKGVCRVTVEENVSSSDSDTGGESG